MTCVKANLPEVAVVDGKNSASAISKLVPPKEKHLEKMRFLFCGLVHIRICQFSLPTSPSLPTVCSRRHDKYIYPPSRLLPIYIYIFVQ